MASVGRQELSPQPRNLRLLELADTATYDTGAHQLKAGADINRASYVDTRLPFNFGGRYVFAALPAAPGLLPVPISSIQAVALGIPAGYEFASLLESLEMVAKGDSGLAPATREKLKLLSSPLNLQVFVTPTCPYCPRAVLTAFRFAMESRNVRASMVEASEFPHLANKYQVSGVPHTVIGDSPQPMIGAYPEAAAADMLVAASQGMKEI